MRLGKWRLTRTFCCTERDAVARRTEVAQVPVLTGGAFADARLCGGLPKDARSFLRVPTVRAAAMAFS